ncbi:hypothetical protein TYRP_002646 [Tyrophagus putrescentiae]|nr:hypothetical protein TYRP_002646 [Tyrophagus putrescentiae]
MKMMRATDWDAESTSHMQPHAATAKRANARRLGPRSLRSRDPRRRTFLDLARSARKALGNGRWQSPKSAAHPDVTWAMCNARHLGPCSLRSQGPRRRALHIAQVTSDLAALDCALPPHHSTLPAPQGKSGGSDSSDNGENGSDKRALTG